MERVFFLKTVRMIYKTSLTLSWVLIGIKVLFPELTDGTLAREPQTVEELTETETTDPSLIPSEKRGVSSRSVGETRRIFASSSETRYSNSKL